MLEEPVVEIPRVRFGPRDEDEPPVRLNLFVVADIGEAELTTICRSITALWERLSDDPVDLDVVIADEFRAPDGGLVEYPTRYIRGRWTITIGVDQIRGWPSTLELNSRLALASAHEAVHAVQDYEGRLPPQAFSFSSDHPLEEEAWRWSLDLCRSVSRESDTEIGAGWRLPERSSFPDDLEGVQFAWAFAETHPNIKIVDTHPDTGIEAPRKKRGRVM